MTSDYTVLDSAYEIYLRDKSPSAGLALCRALRLSGHAEEAIRVLKELADSVDDPFFRAQIGIDMNLLGLFSQAEPLLSQSLSVLHHEPDRRALTAELLISQYAVEHGVVACHFTPGEVRSLSLTSITCGVQTRPSGRP